MSDEVPNEYGWKNYILCCRWGEETGYSRIPQGDTWKNLEIHKFWLQMSRERIFATLA